MTTVVTSSENVFLFVLFEFDNSSSGDTNCEYITKAHLYSIYENGQVKKLHEITLEKCWIPEDITVVPGMGSVSYYPGNFILQINLIHRNNSVLSQTCWTN